MTRLIDADALIPMMKYATTDSEIGVFPIKIGFNAITEVINNAPTIDAVPIECIEKRIAELKKLNEYEFIANGGYTSPSDYEQWELERLIRDWKEENNGQG